MLSKDFWKRCLCIAAAVLMAGAMTPGMAQSGGDEQPALNPRVKSTIEADGYRFIDLNGNGELDVYEDWRQDAQTRANDLVSQMTAREKIARCSIPPISPAPMVRYRPILKNGAKPRGSACC